MRHILQLSKCNKVGNSSKWTAKDGGERNCDGLKFMPYSYQREYTHKESWDMALQQTMKHKNNNRSFSKTSKQLLYNHLYNIECKIIGAYCNYYSGVYAQFLCSLSSNEEKNHILLFLTKRKKRTLCENRSIHKNMVNSYSHHLGNIKAKHPLHCIHMYH